MFVASTFSGQKTSAGVSRRENSQVLTQTSCNLENSVLRVQKKFIVFILESEIISIIFAVDNGRYSITVRPLKLEFLVP